MFGPQTKPSQTGLRLVYGPEDPVSGAHLATRYRELIQNADVVARSKPAL